MQTVAELNNIALAFAFWFSELILRFSVSASPSSEHERLQENWLITHFWFALYFILQKMKNKKN